MISIRSLTFIFASVLIVVGSHSAKADIDRDTHVVLGTPDAPAAPEGVLTFVLDDGTSENAIGDSGQFVWINRFTPNPGDFPFLLEEVEVQFGSTAVPLGGAIEIVIHEDTDGDGDPGTNANFLASYSDTVQANDGSTFSTYSLVPPVQIDGPGDLLVGVINRYGSEGLADFPARLDETSSQGRSWAGSYLAGDVPAMPTYPADEQWGTIDSFGFPGNWMVRASGTRIFLSDLEIGKDGELADGEIVYTITVINNGPDDATNVVVTDPLPPEVTYASDDCGGVLVPPWTWTVGSLAAGASAVCNLTVELAAGFVGDVTNTASVTADQTDPVSGNEDASVTVSRSLLEIPALGGAGILLLIAVLAAAGFYRIARR